MTPFTLCRCGHERSFHDMDSAGYEMGGECMHWDSTRTPTMCPCEAFVSEHPRPVLPTVDREALSGEVECPRCGAKPGERCHQVMSDDPKKVGAPRIAHPARFDAAKARPAASPSEGGTDTKGTR